MIPAVLEAQQSHFLSETEEHQLLLSKLNTKQLFLINTTRIQLVSSHNKEMILRLEEGILYAAYIDQMLT